MGGKERERETEKKVGRGVQEEWASYPNNSLQIPGSVFSRCNRAKHDSYPTSSEDFEAALGAPWRIRGRASDAVPVGPSARSSKSILIAIDEVSFVKFQIVENACHVKLNAMTIVNFFCSLMTIINIRSQQHHIAFSDQRQMGNKRLVLL